MKITQVVGHVLSSPYGDGKVLGQPLGVKSIGFVEVHTDAGLIGLGETYSGIYVPEMLQPVVDFLEKRIIGLDPEQTENVAKAANIPFISRNGLVSSIYSAIDIALWDIKSQITKKPIYKLLNEHGSEKKRVYASGGSVAFQPDELKKDVDQILALGFDAYKMRVGYQTWSRDIERVSVVRQSLGPDKVLMIDAIMGTLNPPWTSTLARQRLQDLVQFQPYWIEEPLHPSDLLGHIALHQGCPVKIATGEALSGTLEYESYLAAKAVDFIQLDVTHCGGITLGMKIINRAEQAGIPVAMHVWGSGLALAANAHLAFASKQVEWLEIPLVNLAITGEMTATKQVIREGVMLPPSAPGLGVTLTAGMKDRYRFVKGSGYQL